MAEDAPPTHDAATSYANAPSGSDELARLQDAHQEQLARLTTEHQALVSHLRSSLEYRLGQALIDLRNKEGRRAFPSRIRSIAADVRRRRRRSDPIAISGPVRRPLKVAVVLDEFSQACWGPEANLIEASPDRSRLEGTSLVFAETAWNGNRGTWAGELSRYSENGRLVALLREAKRQGLPSVLWNKEDPINYDIFIAAARAFDAVLTTDSDSVDRYRRDLGHDRIATMMFAAQPRIHNPLGRALTARPSACFAGSWRGHKYPERVTQLTQLLDAAIALDALVIYDRQPESALRGDTFPERFQDSIAGHLDYVEMLKRYRQHHVFINTNSVASSPTMLSRRVFELLACGTPVISTPSRAIDEHFAGLVATPTTPTEARETMELFLSDAEHRDRIGHLGYRLVHSQHTYQHRLNEMIVWLDELGLCDGLNRNALSNSVTQPPTVSVLMVSTHDEQALRLARQISTQTQPIRQIMIVTPGSGTVDITSTLDNSAEVLLIEQIEGMSIGEALEAARRLVKADYMAIMANGHTYAPNYLGDLMLAAAFSGAAIVGKASYFSVSNKTLRHHGRGAEFSDLPADVAAGEHGIHPATALIDIRATAGLAFAGADLAAAVSTLVAQCAGRGRGVLSADRYNFIEHCAGTPAPAAETEMSKGLVEI